MKNTRKFLGILRRANEILAEIDSNIDLARLITVSNAQGSLARIVRDAVITATNESGVNPESPSSPIKGGKVKRRKSLNRKMLS